jgi:hypothetical protein
VRGRWEHTAIVREPPVVVDPDRPRPLPNVAAVGHSWGAKVAARLAAERRVRCVAGISGTWDDTAGASPDLRRARVPALLIGAMEDTTISAHPTNQPFCEQVPPIHQASLLGIGHWDLSEIAACGEPRPAQARGSRVIAAEMLTVFMHRYLYSNSRLSPQLIGPAGGRPSLRPFLTREGGCAVRLRYRDPFTEPGKLRAFGYGHWPRELHAWRDC